MGKALAITSAVGGGGVVAVGGYYVISNVSSSGKTESEQIQDAQTIDLLANVSKPKDTSSLTLSTFKSTDTKTTDCLKDLFASTTIDFNASTDNPSTVPTDSNYFGATPATGAQGCLVINYEKKNEESDNKWSGTFTWTWTFVNNDKGFINFNSAQTKDNNELQLTGGFYLLEKSTTNNPNTWNIKWKEEVESAGKNITSSDLQTKFPKESESSPVKIENKDYWGFLQKEAPTSSEKLSQKWIWKYTKGAGNDTAKVDAWSKDLQWWNHLYDKSKGFNLQTQLEAFKGKWEKVSSTQ